MKADEAAGAAAVEDVDEAAGFGDGGGLRATGGSFAEEAEGCFVDVKDGDATLPALTAKRREWSWLRVRALRFKWVGDASAATTVGVVGDAIAKGAVGVAFEGDNLFCRRCCS